MFILYRYLLRQFLQIFMICFCSMFGLYIVIDAFTNLEEFSTYGEKHGGVFVVIGQYYAYRSLSFFDFTSGIVALIAAMFTLALFQRFNELTALLAAGIPKRRIIKPIVLAVLAISVAAAASRELLIPAVRDKLALDSHDLGGERAKELHPKRDNSTDILIRGKQTLAKTRQIQEPNFMLQSLDAPFKQLQAANAFYLPATAEHPGGYLLVGVSQPRDLAKRTSLLQDGQPIIFTPHDYPWLKDDQCFVASQITFEQLVGADDWRQYASFLELVAGLRNRSLALGADVAVAIHSRPLQPLLDMTLLFLGLPLMLRRGNRNIFVAIGMCVGLVVAFLMLVMGAQSLGANYYISPALAAWLPLMVFVPMAVAMSDPLRE
jgi:lipopolysaccharide export system permease protein